MLLSMLMIMMYFCYNNLFTGDVYYRYYVNNDYDDITLSENPPAIVELSKVQRNILADKPRVTRFPIEWTKNLDTNKDKNNMNNSLNMENDSPMLNDEDLLHATALDEANDEFYLASDEDMMNEDDEEDEMELDDIDLENDMEEEL